jgi:hypothetical protein
MRNPLPILAAVLLGGCSAVALSNDPVSRRPVTVQVETPKGTYPIRMIQEEEIATRWVNAPVEEVWSRLLDAYPALGVEVRAVDTEQHIAGNQHMRVRRRLGEEELSSFIDCGTNPIGAPYADAAAVELDVLTQLTESGEGTMVATHVGAHARPSSGSSSLIRCTSTGALEEQIARKLGASSGD